MAAIWMLGGIHAAAAEQEASVTTDIQSGGVSIRMNRYGDAEKSRNGKMSKTFCRGRRFP